MVDGFKESKDGIVVTSEKKIEGSNKIRKKKGTLINVTELDSIKGCLEIKMYLFFLSLFDFSYTVLKYV